MKHIYVLKWSELNPGSRTVTAAIKVGSTEYLPKLPSRLLFMNDTFMNSLLLN